MSTEPTEAHRKLLSELCGPLSYGYDYQALQLLADSEARAVERWSGGLDMSLPDLYEAAKSERDKAQAALAAERERVRVLREALEFWKSLRDESKGLAGFHLNGDMAEWDYFTTDPTDTALAATAEKEGSA